MNRIAHSKQKGASLIVVLVLLTVLLLAVTTLARRGEATSLINGAIANKDAALEASEVGVAEAYAALQALATPDVNDATWYFATKQPDDAVGLPTGITWANMKSVTVGPYKVQYLVERLCSVTPVTDADNQCSVKKAYNGNSGKAGVQALASTPGVQYRTTVKVTGLKNGNTFVQTLAVN